MEDQINQIINQFKKKDDFITESLKSRFKEIIIDDLQDYRL